MGMKIENFEVRDPRRDVIGEDQTIQDWVDGFELAEGESLWFGCGRPHFEYPDVHISMVDRANMDIYGNEEYVLVSCVWVDTPMPERAGDKSRYSFERWNPRRNHPTMGEFINFRERKLNKKIVNAKFETYNKMLEERGYLCLKKGK